MSASVFPLGRRAQQAGAEKGAFLEVEGLSAGEKNHRELRREATGLATDYSARI